jgi:hypothetical protein
VLSFQQFILETFVPDETGHYTLYHGTDNHSADHLLKHGWKPNEHHSGNQCGRKQYLYLTNHPDNARWYADQKGSNRVLKVRVHKSHLKVDPEDGIADTVHDELNIKHGLPGNVVAHVSLPAHHFSNHSLHEADLRQIKREVGAYFRANPHDRDVLHNCDASKGRCDSVSKGLAKHFNSKGIKSHVIGATGFKPELPADAHPDWQKFKGKDQRFLWHATVKAGNHNIDTTGAQYGKEHAGIKIQPHSEFKKKWTKLKKFEEFMKEGFFDDEHFSHDIKGWMSPKGHEHLFSPGSDHESNVPAALHPHIKKAKRHEEKGNIAMKHGYARFGRFGNEHYIQYDDKSKEGHKAAHHALKYMSPQHGHSITVTKMPWSKNFDWSNEKHFTDPGKAAAHLHKT